MWASLLGDCPKVSELLAKGADIHLRDSEQRTPLHHASRSGCAPCTKSLLNAGADANVVDINGNSPLHDIVLSDHTSKDLDELVQVLNKAGAELEKRNNSGFTPLFLATDKGLTNRVTLLLKHSADVNTLDYSNSPPIARAIFMDHCEVLEIICSAVPFSHWGQNVPYDPEELIELGDVLIESAIFASSKAMEILTASAIERVDYKPELLDFLFEKWRDDSYSNTTGVSSDEEDLAAFRQLLEAKGNAIAPIIDELPSVSSNPTFEEPEVDEGDEIEVYEDALEHMASLSIQQETPLVTATG
jgi:ankyrin repeat protein